LVPVSLHEAARLAFEELMANSDHPYQSDFAKRFVAEEKKEGPKGRSKPS
jgi:hypothetical protein